MINVGLEHLVVLLNALTCITLASAMPLSFTDANGTAGLMELPVEELHDAKEVRGNVLALKINGESTDSGMLVLCLFLFMASSAHFNAPPALCCRNQI